MAFGPACSTPPPNAPPPERAPVTEKYSDLASENMAKLAEAATKLGSLGDVAALDQLLQRYGFAGRISACVLGARGGISRHV